MRAERTDEEPNPLGLNVQDQHGPPTDSVLHLAEYLSSRLLTDRIGFESVDREGASVVLKFRPDAKLDPAWLYQVVQRRDDVTLVPPATLKLDLKKAVSSLTAPPPSRPAPSVAVKTGKKGRDPVAACSWWAAPAQPDEVAPGFPKDEIMRPAKEDPRAGDGVFSRVSGLLKDLSGGRSIE
jgi:hypothetical protein